MTYKQILAAGFGCTLALAGYAQAATLSTRLAGATTSVGTINLKQLAVRGARGPLPSTFGTGSEMREMPRHLLPRRPATQIEIDAAFAAVPTAMVTGISTSPNTSGFDALDHNDQRTIADNGNQFSLEPPDQALAVGNGFVLEAVNNALMVYDTTGKPLLAAPVSMNRFFNQVSEYNRQVNPPQQGPFLSDPRAFYDSSTQRFFVVEWSSLGDASGNKLGISVQFVAVSQTSDPTGSWFLYNFETTNPTVANCPCFPDFQQLGVDQSGIYISANLFGIFGSAYAGDKIYALPKAGLEAGTGATVLEFPVLPTHFTVHPTVVPPGGSFATEANGTEYLLESRADLTASGAANAVNVFAISNTASLAGTTPSLTLGLTKVPTQRVANGSPSGLPPAIQPVGPRPLGGNGTNGLHDPRPKLSADDSRFSSAPVYVNGQIWAVVDTAVIGTGLRKSSAVAWFDIAASGGASDLTASVTAQGVVAAPQIVSLLYPAVAMPVSGKGAIGVTLVGPNNYPSTAIIPLSASGNGAISISGFGKLPDDGFTAYAQYGGAGVGRWGDYGAAAVDEAGAMWFANEYIPQTTPLRPRSLLANWGTYISKFRR